jgi:DNA mismatch repair protein MutL
MKTKQDQEELGTQIVEGSKFVSQDGTAERHFICGQKSLFNIPARRNFLKSDTVEYRHIIDEFQRVALAHPNIYFTFFHNGSEMFNLPPSSMRQRIVYLFWQNQ